MARKSKTKNRSNARKSAGQDGNIHLSRSDRLSTAAKRAPSKSKKTQKKGFWLWRLIRFFLKPAPRLAYWGLVFGLWGGIAAVGIIGFYAAKLPNASDWAIPQRPPNMKVVAMDASLIGNRGMTGGKALRLEEMSPYIAQAVIAIEDRRFHAHFGFDPIGFSRAMWRNISQKRMREGGSTITQQLAKNLFLTPDRTFGRKVQELILAVWLETKFTKAEILELYLNRVIFWLRCDRCRCRRTTVFWKISQARHHFRSRPACWPAQGSFKIFTSQKPQIGAEAGTHCIVGHATGRLHQAR